MSRPKVLRHPVVLTGHAFDKLWAIDITLAELRHLLVTGEVIQEQVLSIGRVKELVLVAEWHRPLHVVVVVDRARREERILTVYEPDSQGWRRDRRRRR